MAYKSFKDLPPLKARPEKTVAKVEPVPVPDPGEPDPDLFVQAMRDVSPLNEGKGGRDLAPERPSPPGGGSSDPDAAARQHLNDLVQGRVEFEIEFTSEFIHGHVVGLSDRTFGQLKSGKFSTEAHLDLHGYTLQSAQAALLVFVREQYLSGRRCLLVITGRGRNSPEGRGLLRDEVQTWLTQEPLKRVVLAFASALPRHGGAGALYVLLRRSRQDRGKVLWDRFPLGKDL